jgi:predicted nucleotidyltransferase
VFKDLIKRIATELSRRKIPYMIIGGQAVLHYGEPRLTKDIDITLGLGVEKLSVMEDAVKTLGLVIEATDVESFVRRHMVLPTADRKKGIRVDFIFSITPFEREAIARAREVDFDGVPVRFASLEDLVLHKMLAGRPRDIEDVKSVLLKNPGYDRDYIRGWLADFDKATGGDCVDKLDHIIKDIAREAGRRLARLGGTAKELKPIPGRRSPRFRSS